MSEKLKVSVLFRSNLFQLADCFRARVPLSPFSPKMMMNTLASVPAPGKGIGEALGPGISHKALFSGLIPRLLKHRGQSLESMKLG